MLPSLSDGHGEKDNKQYPSINQPSLQKEPFLVAPTWSWERLIRQIILKRPKSETTVPTTPSEGFCTNETLQGARKSKLSHPSLVSGLFLPSWAFSFGHQVRKKKRKPDL